MSDDKNAFSDWLNRRFMDPLALAQERDHEGFIFGLPEGGDDEGEGDQPAL
jgi:hypothetical protein